VTRLAAKLQKQFPSIEFLHDGRVHTVQLRWLPENLYPATGAYRTNVILDCCRWEGFAQGVKDNGSTYTVCAVYGYSRMSDLIRPGALVWHNDNEITNERTD